MYTTDRAEQALDDISKVFLLYEHDIISSVTAREIAYRIVDLYTTKCLVNKEGLDYGKTEESN